MNARSSYRIFSVDVATSKIVLVTVIMPLVSSCDDSGAGDGGRSDAHCIARIWAARNNMKVDFRRTDSSARTDADSTRKDNN